MLGCMKKVRDRGVYEILAEFRAHDEPEQRKSESERPEQNNQASTRHDLWSSVKGLGASVVNTVGKVIKKVPAHITQPGKLAPLLKLSTPIP